MSTTVTCHVCGESFTQSKPSDAMTYRRIHMEERHLEAKIETDT
jgi:hypothetical protein